MASQTSSVDETMAGKKPDEPPTSANGKKKMTARRLLRRFFKDGKHVWKPILLIFLNGFYLLFGGTVFLLLEKTEPIQFNISTEISEVLQVLNETRPGLINLHEETEKMAPSDLEKWETVLEKIHERRVKAESPRWTLSHSVFFCTTLLTTIGYGDIAPVTTPGRFFCIIYAFVGIPFNIMFLAVLGKSMADVINRICAEIIRLWTSYLHPNYEWKSLTAETEINAPVWLGLIILGSFLCFCAWIYSISEDWNYWTACYFTFITFTTIGLGDIVPERTETMVFIDTTLLYIGLAVLALTVNLIVANIVHQMKKTREKLPFVDRFEMSSVNTSEPNETNEDNSEEKD